MMHRLGVKLPYFIAPALLAVILLFWVRSFLPSEFFFFSRHGRMLLVFVEGQLSMSFRPSQVAQGYTDVAGPYIDSTLTVLRSTADVHVSRAGIEYLSSAGKGADYRILLVPYAYLALIAAGLSAWSAAAWRRAETAMAPGPLPPLRVRPARKPRSLPRMWNPRAKAGGLSSYKTVIHFLFIKSNYIRQITLAARIIEYIRQQGFFVSEFRINGSVEYHAIPFNGDAPRQLARCNDGDDDESAYHAACLLARAVGVELGEG